MLCPNCKVDRIVSDFINNQKLCYRCAYQKKAEKAAEIRVTPRPMCCRLCKAEIIHKKGLKKRQRTVFCSMKCAEEGHRQMNNNHWTRNIYNTKITLFRSDYP